MIELYFLKVFKQFFTNFLKDLKDEVYYWTYALSKQIFLKIVSEKESSKKTFQRYFL